MLMTLLRLLKREAEALDEISFIHRKCFKQEPIVCSFVVKTLGGLKNHIVC